MADKTKLGYVKLYRCVIDSIVFQNPNLLKMWIWCLCKASHSKCDILVGLTPVTLNPGQFIFGRKIASLELNMTESYVYKLLTTLKNMKMCNSKSNNKFTVITIEKWEDFQCSSNKEYQQTCQQRNNNVTTTCQQRNTNKNDKECNKNDKEYIGIVPDPLKKDFIAYIEMRKKIKRPLTESSIKMAISKLENLAPGDYETQKQILQQSVFNCWQGLFPIPQAQQKREYGPSGGALIKYVPPDNSKYENKGVNKENEWF